jgi:PIN domain nuclease of toxin-antitoxin system
MRIICDTHVLLFWADQPDRLSGAAVAAVEQGMEKGGLACADISLWEIAMLYARGRINNQAGVTAADYIRDILTAMEIDVLPIDAEISEIAQSEMFAHGDPADRLIAATAQVHRLPLVTADTRLRAITELRCIW